MRHLYATGTWKAGPQLAPGNATDLSPDGRLVVQRGAEPGFSHLVDSASGKELAVLENPDSVGHYPVFTPDGTRVVMSAPDGLSVWDLRLLRKGLAREGFDWDAPAYLKANKAAPTALEVEVVGADLLEAKAK